MARKRTKTKAQKEYERVRKNINAYQKRHKTDYEMPHTPSQELIGNVSARDYKEYTKELKQFYKNIQQLEAEKARQEEEQYIPYADAVIYQFRGLFNVSTKKEAKGRDFVLDWVDKLISTHGKLGVALMLIDAQEKAGLSFSADVLYNIKSANIYTQGLQKFLKSTGMKKADLLRLQEKAEADEPFLNI